MSELIPRTDPFTAGATAYGSFLLGWTACEPRAAGYNYGLLTNTYAGENAAGTSIAPSTGHKASNASVIRTSGAGTDADVFAFLRREYFDADCQVSARFYAREIESTTPASAVTPTYVESWEVLARMQGGTPTDAGTDDTRLVDMSGYGFRLRGNASNELNAYLVRWNAGTETEIASVEPAFTTAEAESIPLTDGLTMRLVLVDTDDGVSYQCLVEDTELSGTKTSGGIVVLEGTDETLRNYADASEDFSAAAWSSTFNVTINTNVGTAPDGTTTTDGIEDTSASFKGYFERTFATSVVAVGEDAVFTLHVEEDSSAECAIQLAAQGGPTEQVTAKYVFATGEYIASTTSSPDYSIEVLPSLENHVRLRVTMNVPTGSSGIRVRFFPANDASADTDTTNAWGAQYEVGSETDGTSLATAYQAQTAGSSTRPTITGSGRCGFSMSSARGYTTPTVDVVDVCDWLQVAEGESGDAVLFREEWIRWFPEGGQLHASDTHGYSGQVVMSDYTLDQYCDRGPRWERTGDRIELSVGGGATGAFIGLASHRLGDQYTQRRSITVQFTSGTTTSAHGVQVVLRGSFPNQLATPVQLATGIRHFRDFAGYGAYAESVSGETSWRVGINRFTGTSGGTGTQIANLDYVSIPWTNGSDFTLDFEVRPVADLAPHGDIETAHVEMKVRLDTGGGLTQVVLGSATTDVTIDGDGTVTDANSGRIQGGWGQGFTAGIANSTRTIEIDDFAQGVRGYLLDRSPITVGDEGTPTVNLTDVLTPHFEIVTETRNTLIRHEMDSGHREVEYEFGDASGPLDRRVFTITCPCTSVEEHKRIGSLFALGEGVAVPFYFTDENGVDVSVTFAEESLSRVQIAPGVYGTSFKLIERY